MSKVRHFNNSILCSENKENQPFYSSSTINTRTIYSNENQSRITPTVVFNKNQDSDSDTDSDGNINWKDYYGDDEHGLNFN
jgi:hypothetical protein